MPYSQLVDAVGSSVHTSGKRKNEIHRITVHCYVGNATVEEMVVNFRQNSRGASCNYAIAKDGKIAVILGEEYRSYCSSSHENDEQAVCIECACSPKYPYEFPDATYQRTIELCTDICRRNGKKKLLWIENKTKRLSYQPADDEMVLTLHRDFFDTACPGQWMVEHEADLAQKVTEALNPVQICPAAGDTTAVAEEPEPAEKPITEHGLQAHDLAALSNVEIVDTVGPLFTADQQKTGILASVSMAQFILESGYCRTELAKAANNCFGMKAIISGNTWPGSVWQEGNVYNMATDEYRADGTKYTIWEDFRKYSCIEDSIADHSAYLCGALKDGSPRYAGLVGCADYKQAAQILVDGGYATAPEYANYLCNLIEMWGLGKWDAPQDEQPEKQDEQQEPLFPDTQIGDTVTIPVSDWNAIKAAIVVAYQAVRKHDDVG